VVALVIDAAELAAFIRRYRFTFASEERLQEALGDVLAQRYPVLREVRLDELGRIDFLVGRVGIEVKVQGSTADLLRQVKRYCKSDQVDEVLVVTTRSRHTAIEQVIDGKRVSVLAIGLEVL
jgi:hypothetical protein